MVIGTTETPSKKAWRENGYRHYREFTGHKKLPSDRHAFILGEVGSLHAHSMVQSGLARPNQIFIINNESKKIRALKRQNRASYVVVGSMGYLVAQLAEPARAAIIDYDSQYVATLGLRDVAIRDILELLNVAPQGCMITANVALNCNRHGLGLPTHAEARRIIDEFRDEIIQEIPYFYQKFARRHCYVYRGEGRLTVMGTMYFYKK